MTDTSTVARTGAAAAMLPWLVFAVWLAAVGAAFWQFEFRWQRPFAAATEFDAAMHTRTAEAWFRTLAAAGRADSRRVATVVHVYQPECACNRYSEPHVRELESRYAPRGIGFLRVEIGGAAAADSPGWLNTTPAALVFDAGGKLLYYGPYSDAAWCGAQSGLVEPILESALRGRPPLQRFAAARGCFCARTGVST